jgi:hypothetical protein
MSVPEHLMRPEVRRDARRVASSVSKVRIKRDAAFPDTENIVLLDPARADRLADRWRAATTFESLRGRAFAHPTFADFAELGDEAIVLAVNRLTTGDEVGLWLDVLDEIADGPRSSQADLEELTAEWLRWARSRELIR